jgi:hypothetical protein
MRDWRKQDQFFQRLFSQDPMDLEHAHHPSDEVLRAYLRGYASRRWRDPESLLSKLTGKHLDEWRHPEISAHVLTCGACRQRTRVLQREEVSQRTVWTAVDEWVTDVRRRWRPVPRPAWTTMAVQFVLIVALAGMLFLQPAPFFPRPARESAASTVTRGQSPPQAAPPGPTLEMASFLPLPVTQAMQTLDQDPNPERRMAAAQSLRSYADVRLVEPLTQVFEREGHPQVRRVIAETLTIIWDLSEDQFTSSARTLERIRERHVQEFGFSVSFGFNLEDQGLQALRIEFQYPYETLCASRPDLTLEQLSEVLSEFEGVLVVDRSISAGGFRLRLPRTLGAMRTLDQLESQLGIVCRK